jgi:hypothetical protein
MAYKKSDPPPDITVDEAFSRRINQAADESERIPMLHQGRLTYIRDQFKIRFGKKVALESVRKWFNGWGKPRDATLVQLAQILSCDPVWLRMGGELKMTPTPKPVSTFSPRGNLNAVVGLLQMGGYVVGMPNAGLAKATAVDLIVTVGMEIHHICLAKVEKAEGSIRVAIPRNHAGCVVLAIVPNGDFEMSVLQIEPDAAGAKPSRDRSTLELSIGNLKTHTGVRVLSSAREIRS